MWERKWVESDRMRRMGHRTIVKKRNWVGGSVCVCVCLLKKVGRREKENDRSEKERLSEV